MMLLFCFLKFFSKDLESDSSSETNVVERAVVDVNRIVVDLHDAQVQTVA